jgi:hypothetical protein
VTASEAVRVWADPPCDPVADRDGVTVSDALRLRPCTRDADRDGVTVADAVAVSAAGASPIVNPVSMAVEAVVQVNVPPPMLVPEDPAEPLPSKIAAPTNDGLLSSSRCVAPDGPASVAPPPVAPPPA